jgi:hypothetical protein
MDVHGGDERGRTSIELWAAWRLERQIDRNPFGRFISRKRLANGVQPGLELLEIAAVGAHQGDNLVRRGRLVCVCSRSGKPRDDAGRDRQDPAPPQPARTAARLTPHAPHRSAFLTFWGAALF